MIYGIPGFKLEKPIVLRRAEQLIEGGIQFQLNCELGRDVHASPSCAQRHDAVLHRHRRLQGARDGGRRAAASTTSCPRSPTSPPATARAWATPCRNSTAGALDAEGKRVVVIGGGDTAMDCVRTAVRQGAISVHCLYRRDRANMPGSQREVAHAEEEGVQFVWLAQPEAFLGDADNRVSGVRCQRIHLGLPDATGRQTPRVIERLELHHRGRPRRSRRWASIPRTCRRHDRQPRTSTLTNWGTLKIDWRNLMTSMPGVFAAGDIVRGASLVVWAIRDGRDAAAAIDSYVTQRASWRQSVTLALASLTEASPHARTWMTDEPTDGAEQASP